MLNTVPAEVPPLALNSNLASNQLKGPIRGLKLKLAGARAFGHAQAPAS